MADLANVAEPRGAELGWRNWANLVAYGFNSVVTYASIFGAFGPSNTDLSAKYQLLVTPAGFAFSIWGPIFIWEGLFAVAQMFPRFRGTKIVKLVSPGWLVACFFQVMWTLIFAKEWMPLALVCMLGIFAGLFTIAVSSDGFAMTWSEYFILRGGFSLHLGWIIAATALNVNVVADAAKASPGTLLGLAITSIGVICVLAACFALVAKSADPIIGIVAAWALNAIRVKLSDPVELDDPTRYNPYMWDRVTLEGLQLATTLVSFVALAWAAVAITRVVMAVWFITDSKRAATDDVQEQQEHDVVQEA